MTVPEEVSLEVALDHHLRYNHYPPAPHLIPVARGIIDRWNNGDHGLDYVVDAWRGSESVTAAELAEALHLECFGVGVLEE